ncbi:hypothetical protein MKY53_02705 [Macrococcus sp. FSL R5-0951]
MKIKQKRQVRLDELLKYVWGNGINDIEFHSDNDSWIRIDDYGDLVKVYEVEESDLFTITEEVEIDYDTILDLIAVRKVGTVSRFENRSIQGVLVHFEGEVDYIYFQNPDGSIADLIWSKERGLID